MLGRYKIIVDGFFFPISLASKALEYHIILKNYFYQIRVIASNILCKAHLDIVQETKISILNGSLISFFFFNFCRL